MAQEYVVTYTINVNGVEAAQATIDKFVNAVNKLNVADEPFRKLKAKLDELKPELQALTQSSYKIRVDTSEAVTSLKELTRQLRVVKKLAIEAGRLSVMHPARTANSSSGGNNGGGSGGNTAVVSGENSSGNRGDNSSGRSANGGGGGRGGYVSKNVIARNIPPNIGYKALGPTPVDVGGIQAVSILKGMGIAYGMSAIGSMVSRIGQDAAAYDNAMQTVRNILESHDRSNEFSSNFMSMERIVRNVGVETKYTAPEVAEAAKFLAMAGFDVGGISRSIRPISDIALVGDTDLGETADVVTNIMTGYGIAPEKLRNAADIMTMTFTKSNTTLMEMAEAYKYSASLLALNGTPFEEATAALGILGDAGIKGSQAGTTMRTIALNIAKPTKQQAKEWEAIGVNRLDSNGNVRDLYAIFEDLHKKNLSVAQLGRLFHKTATMGAGVLAANIEKWNEVIELNFLSDGMASRLAEEKKNTIQGLWAQLTSMFTEDGIQAFEGIQGPIKDMLRSITEWLKTPEAGNAFKKLANDVMEFAHIIKDSTAYLLKFLDKMWFLIKPWMELQLRIWPVITAFKVFKGMMGGVGAVTAMAGGIFKLAGRFRALWLAISATNAASGGFWKGVIPNIKNGFRWAGAQLGDYAGAQYYSTATGRQIRPAVIERARTYGVLHRWGGPVGKALGGIALGGVSGVGGSLLGGAIGGAFDSEGSGTGQLIGNIAGGLIGGIGLPLLVSKIAAFATGLAFWPAALVAACSALGYFAYKTYQSRNEIDNAIEANKRYMSSIATLNGISYSDHATKADKFYAVLYNDQLNVNEAISAHINLLKEQLGIIDEVSGRLDDGKKIKEAQKETYERLTRPFEDGTKQKDWEDAATAAAIVNGSASPYLTPVLFTATDAYGGIVNKYKFMGEVFSANNKEQMQQLAVWRYLASIGQDTSEGSDARKIIDRYNLKFLRSRNLNDWNTYSLDWDAETNSLLNDVIEGSNRWAGEALENHTLEELKKSAVARRALYDTLLAQFSINDPQTPNAKMLAAFSDILAKFQNNETISQNELKDFLFKGGIDVFNESRYGKFGTPEWLKNLGYYDNKWHPLQYQKEYIDANGVKRVRTEHTTEEETRKLFAEIHNMVKDLIDKLHPDIQSLFQPLVNNLIWDLGLSDGEGTGRSTNGQMVSWDNRNYIYRNGWWYPGNDRGRIGIDNENSIVGGPPVTDAILRHAMGLDVSEQKTDTDSDTPGPALNSATTDYNSGYKSNYRSSSAAPKQVIVNIENLMNVESVDMSKPENKEVIANLKDQLSQALVDVVHEFDATWS